MWCALCAIALLAVATPTSCRKSDEEQACQAAEGFAQSYFNYKYDEAKRFCVSDLHPVIDFRNGQLLPQDREAFEKNGPATVRVIKCQMQNDNEQARIHVEVSNYVRINYLNDDLTSVACDTVMLTLSRQLNHNWLVKDPI